MLTDIEIILRPTTASGLGLIIGYEREQTMPRNLVDKMIFMARP